MARRAVAHFARIFAFIGLRDLIKALHGVLARLGSMPPPRLVLVGYLTYIVLGWLLLCIPVCARREAVGALDNLFIATSAVSTTGLVTVSVADRYSVVGQVVILVLIQLGGIGYMTLGSFLVLSRKTELPSLRAEVGRAVFSLPQSFRIDKFIRSVIRFTLVIELGGTLALWSLFHQAGVNEPLWNALFHSVSAFCTAGFSLFNTSFESFSQNVGINLVIVALSYAGAVGFIVWVDFWRMFRGAVAQMTLTSKIILSVTFWFTVLGTTLLFLTEPSIRHLSGDDRLLAAFFQCMTAMTTVGFNSINIAALSKASVLLVIVMMVIGASPAGTGGGVKSTTFTAVVGLMRSTLRAETTVRFWGRAVPQERVWMAGASLAFYLLALVIGTYLLDLSQGAEFEASFFEAASALGTVGLSMGITPSLTGIGKLIVIALMFCGRVGPLTFGAALFCRRPDEPVASDSDLAV
jgi:trk system potassium uptake protein TrkH